MTKEKPFSCQFWSAPDQQWVLHISESFSTILKAKKYGRENYKEFRVIEHGVVRYTRLWQDDVLVESVGAVAFLAEGKGSTLQEARARQRSKGMNENDLRMTVKLLENISGELEGIDSVLGRVRYFLKALGHDTVTQDVTRQISLLGSQIRRLDNLSYKLHLMEQDLIAELGLETEE